MKTKLALIALILMVLMMVLATAVLAVPTPYVYPLAPGSSGMLVCEEGGIPHPYIGLDNSVTLHCPLPPIFTGRK